MTMLSGRKIGKSLISETNASITDTDHARILKDEVYHVIEEEPEVASVELKGFVLFSEKREFEEHQVEQVLEGTNVWHGNPMEHFKDAAG